MSLITRNEQKQFIDLLEKRIKLAVNPYQQGSSVHRRSYTADDLQSGAVERRHLAELRPTASGMMVHIDSGLLYIAGSKAVTFPGGNTSALSSAIANPRIDLVVIDKDGVLDVVTGTESASPSAPDYPSDRVVLAEVTVGVGVSGLYNSNIRDVRPFIQLAGASVVGTAGSGHLIRDNGVLMPNRTALNFGIGFSLVDDSVNDETDISLDIGGIDHGLLAGLGDDDHPQYTTEAEATNIADARAASAVSTHAANPNVHHSQLHASSHQHGGSDALVAFSGDTGTGGTAGYVPAPQAGDAAAGKYLKADGTWTVPPGMSLTVQEQDGTPSVSNVDTIKVTNGTLTDNGGGSVTLDFGSAATDGSAIHDNEAGEIHAIAEKASPVSADEIIIEDSADSYNKKRVQVGNLSGGSASYSSAYASPPASPREGDLWLPTDSFYILRRGASAWAPWGPIFPMTPPPALNQWTWVNRGTATADETYGGIYLYAPPVTGDQWRLLVRPVPGATYTITACFISQSLAVNYNQLGLVWYDGTKLISVQRRFNLLVLSITKWNSVTSFNADYTTMSFQPTGGPWWIQLVDNGTSRVMRWSADGKYWIDFHSVSRTDFLTATHVGIGVNSNNSTSPCSLTLLSWSES